LRDLTIEDLAKVFEQEMTSIALQKLPDGFIQDACKLLETLKSEAKRKEGLERKLAERQLVEATGLLRQLCSVRVTKILSLLISGRVPDNLLEFERSALSEMEGLLREMRERIVSEEEIAIKVPGACARKLIVFREAISEKIVGVDGKIYGPFLPGEIANLPKENAEILTRHALAEEIQVQ